jgi:TMEM175 potassium channel family protein
VPVEYEQIAARNVERLAALSDGLFAIAMTLLIIDLHTPAAEAIRSDADLFQSLLRLAPQIVMYLIGFMTLGIFWIAQQSQLDAFLRVDRDLTWINLGFLAAVALMPFSTALLAHFITYRVALGVYWINMLLCGIGLYASWSYASRAELLKPDVPAETSAVTKRRILGYQLAYLVCVLLSAINTYWSIAGLFLLQLDSAVAPRTRLVRWWNRSDKRHRPDPRR